RHARSTLFPYTTLFRSIGGLNAVNCQTGVVGTDPVEVYADAGSSSAGTNLFRWDGTQWIYNFDTSAFSMKAGNCYRINVYYGGSDRKSTRLNSSHDQIS